MGDLLQRVQLSRSLPHRTFAREIRRAAGVSQQQMADELGVHVLTIARWENGARTPRGHYRERYAKLLFDLQAEIAR